MDRRRFEINAESGNLGFKSAPNYEDAKDIVSGDPANAAGNNQYVVEVEARSGEDRLADSEQQITNRAEQTITVTVLDVDEQPAKPAKPELKAVPDSIADSTTSLRVNWIKPGLNGGPEITDYNVAYREYREGMDGEWTDGDYDGTALTAIITGLDADTDYEARVQAYNGESESEWSDPSEPFSPKSCALNAGDLWCGVVTVAGVQGNAAHGFLDIMPNDGGDLDGNPEDKMFLGYTINGIYVWTTGDASGNLNVILNAALSPGDRATLALHVDGHSEPFAFSAASKPSAAVNAYAWPDTGLNWSSAPTVTLRLRRKAAPMLSIADAQADEGEAVAFMVTLSEKVGADVTVDWEASLATDDTAETGDFTAATGTLTIAASETAATFTVATAQDADEDDETFTVTLSNRSPPWVQLSTATATGTIRDDDGLPEVTIAATPDTVTEGMDAVFTLSRTGSTAAALTVTVEVSQTGEVLADPESEWPSSVTFAANASAATLTLATKDDDTDTGDGTVTVTLPAGTDYEVGTANAATVTVSDNDDNAAPSFTPSSATFSVEENATEVGTVEAEDSDADDSITGYAISGGADQGLFEIDGTSGALTFAAAPDYEDPEDSGTDNVHEVTVQATSGTGTRVMTADQTITVTVTDADEQSAKPDKPELEAVSGSSTSLTATWEAPGKNGGPAITGYKLEYKLSTETSWTAFAHTGTAVTTTITGLTADTSYQARVRAENGETDSDWSDASNAVSTNAETVTPTCTLNTGDIWCGVLTVEAESTTQDGFGGPTGDLSDKTFRVGGRNYAIEQVTVENSTSPNPGFLNFSLDRVLTAADRARLVLHVDDSSDTFAFSAATIFTFSYTWTGTSLDWSSETFVTLRLRLAPQEPGKPTNLMAEADRGTRIALSWDAPADDGGSAITGYRIEVSDDAGSNWDDLVDDTGNDGTNYTHTGLSPGDTRHYRVSAINAEGASVASDVDHATTMREDPAADASLSALDVTRSGGVPVPLHPAFDSDETDYEASVANAVDEVTVAATANVAGATVAYLGGDDNALDDADTGTAGHQVALSVGENTVKVKVTVEDTATTKTYTVTVTRRAPDAPGGEGEWRLMDVESSAAGGVTARAEVFHAGRWGTVCSDGIRDRDFKVFNYDADGNLFEDTVTDSEGNQVQVLSETEYDNEAAVLICQAKGYDNGEYHGKYKYGPGEVPDHQDADYWPAGSTYSGAATPIWIDDLRCVNGDSALTGTAALPGEMSHCSYAGWGLHNCTHKEDAVVRCWNEEGSIDADASHAVGPLTASFADLPSSHEGTAFTFRIEFSEDVAVSVAEMRDHALTVTGAR